MDTLERLDGTTVSARALGWDGRDNDATDWALFHSDLPALASLVGTLTVTYVDDLGYTQYVVNGIPVDPGSISQASYTDLTVLTAAGTRDAGPMLDGLRVFRLDYRAVTGRQHPGEPAKAADAVIAGERVDVTGSDAAALLVELGNRTETTDLTLVTIDGRPELFGAVAHNQLRRKDMPQIPPEHLDEFAAHLQDLGIGTRLISARPLTLAATQNELDGRKVGQMVWAMQNGTMSTTDTPVWISADNRVLDGNHRWAAEAVLAAGGGSRWMKVMRADAPMAILIGKAREFAKDEGIASKHHGMTLHPVAFAGTSEGARRAWESRQRAKPKAPTADTPPAPKPPDLGRAAAIDDRIAALQTEIGPTVAKIEATQAEMNKDSFYRLHEWRRNQTYKDQQQARDSIKDRVAEMNALATERMDLTHQDLPAADYDTERWAKIDLEAGAPIDHPEFGPAGVQANYEQLLAERIKQSGPLRDPRPDAPAWMSKKTIAEQQADLMAEAVRDTATYGSPKFHKARDRWVVADVPTLELNRALRGEIPMTAGHKTRAREAKFLSSGTLSRDTKLSRTMELPPAIAASLRPGSVFETKSYMATQSGRPSPYNRAEATPGTIHTQATILAKAGTHAGDVSYGEIILRPGRMRVLESRWDGTTHYVTMEYLDELA